VAQQRPKENGVRTICEVLEGLRMEAEARGDKITMLRIEEAIDMAKRMQNKLKRYSLKTKDPTTLTVDERGELEWLNKEEFKSERV
jgi:hypothetical protein